MKTVIFWSLLFLLLAPALANGQRLEDCTLGLGGKDTKTIIQVFQLNEEQQDKLEEWAAALEMQNKLVEDQIQELFEKHPQSTVEELNTLAVKYEKLKTQIVEASKQYDRKLLALFNERQYERYVALCRAAYRDPMTVPAKLQDSVSRPEK